MTIASGLKARLPWWGKLGAKLVLARLPISYRVWRRIGIFQHGLMHHADYARRVLDAHLSRVSGHLPAGFSLLELGPGDSLATAVVAAERGAAKVWLVDTGSYALMDVAAYVPLLGHAGAAALPATMDELLDRAHATYLTGGLESLRSLPSDSVDFCFSQAVLEHVPLDEVEDTLSEVLRVLKPGGVTSHGIDLRDHLGDSLHSLRFSRRTWETRAFRTSGFYTNRLRAPELLGVFSAVGFELVHQDTVEWDTLPLPRQRLHRAFRRFSDDELRVRHLDVVAMKPPIGRRPATLPASDVEERAP